MADYIPYTIDEYQPDTPATALHFARWFQNWEAGFEGGAGAPRLRIGALERLVAGDVVRASRDAEATTRSAFLGVMQLGSVRLYAEQRLITGTGTSDLTFRRTRGGSETVLASWSLSGGAPGTGWYARKLDTDVQPGDLIEIRHVSNGNSFVRMMRVSNGGESLWQGYFGASGLQMWNYYA